MSLINKKIFGITITTNPKTEILEYVEKYLYTDTGDRRQETSKKKKPLVIVTPNPEQVVYTKGDAHFADLLNGADIAIPDGIGLVWANRIFSSLNPKPKPLNPLHKISGVELMEDLVAMAAKKGFPIALIGGRTGVALKALECLQLRNPGLKGWAEEGVEIIIKSDKSDPLRQSFSEASQSEKQLDDGAFGQYAEDISKKIETSHACLVFVGLGAPKQEYFIEKLKIENLKLKIAAPLALMSVGGAFDEISGRIPRAPMIIDRVGLKWLWRLMGEPWRWRRQLSLVKFIGLIMKNILNPNSI